MALKNLGKYTFNEDVAEYVKEARRMVSAYGWEEKEVYPYSYPEKVTKIIDMISDYPDCTTGTKYYLLDYANGLAKILNAWEDVELNGVPVRFLKTGKVHKVTAEEAEWMVYEGFCEYEGECL